jgi:hypothetical protein
MRIKEHDLPITCSIYLRSVKNAVFNPQLLLQASLACNLGTNMQAVVLYGVNTTVCFSMSSFLSSIIVSVDAFAYLAWRMLVTLEREHGALQACI